MSNRPPKAAPQCHPERALFCRGKCRPCYNKMIYAQPGVRERRRQYQKEYGARWYRKNCEKKNALKRERYGSQDISIHRETSLRQMYGITMEDYDRMATAQGHVCAICHRPPRAKDRGKRLYVDHCDVTARVRGLLCPGCNTAIGQFLHNVEILQRAIDYLKNPPAPATGVINTKAPRKRKRRPRDEKPRMRVRLMDRPMEVDVG